jgi:uncharacterized membrane protein YcaP (DUF421 family)
MDIVKLILTTLLSVLALFVITKMMGHKQVSQLDFFDYVSGITIGSIGAELATNLEEPYKPLVALILYGAASVILNLIAQKFSKTRKYINGTPTILMSEGKLHRENFKKAKLDLSEFMLMCRELGYFKLDEIRFAVFEHNGRLSILPKAESRPLTPKDAKIVPKEDFFATEVVMDGKIMGENLTRMGLNEAWLLKKLNSAGYKEAGDVFLALYCKEEDKLSVYEK